MEQPTKEAVIKAYNIARETGADSTCKVLEALYPNVDFEQKDNRPVEERIKTFEDAVEALGDDNSLVQQWEWLNGCDVDDTDLGGKNGTFSDVLAYLKLRIIVAALNEGWEPQFVEDELRWYPWFYLYTNEELAEKSEEWKQKHTILDINDRRVVGRSATTRLRMAVSSLRTRTAHRRARSRSAGLGLPSSQKPLPNMQASSLSKSMPT